MVDARQETKNERKKRKKRADVPTLAVELKGAVGEPERDVAAFALFDHGQLVVVHARAGRHGLTRLNGTDVSAVRTIPNIPDAVVALHL